MIHNTYTGRTGLVFGANSFFGRTMSEYLSRNTVDLGLIDLDYRRDDALAHAVRKSNRQVLYRTVPPGDEGAFTKAVENMSAQLGGIDYLICSCYLEDMRDVIDQGDLSIATWDRMFDEWIRSYFLILKAAVPGMIRNKGGKIVFVNTTTGYTGEGEGEGGLAGEGSIHESACSSAITGMMTSIARDIIPQGISVNGIALGPDYEHDQDRILWAANLWLSGMGDYSCAQILRLY
ncbi:MAG: SDR family oxidoreductase [Deltaproteobacteria bacterium]|nr:SDR family oxidoreductase [Deltaproteobacteria bacterium]